MYCFYKGCGGINLKTKDMIKKTEELGINNYFDGSVLIFKTRSIITRVFVFGILIYKNVKDTGVVLEKYS